jgi:RHS repeat-associated protein
MSVGTCYTYDLNNNLTEVVQGSQTRYYYYDGLSRPTQVITPEDGTAYFYYTTSGGSLCAGNPSAVCRKTDSRSVTTTNTYDAMSRVTNTSFSDGSTSLNFYYDLSSWSGVWTLANGAGRLSVTNGGTLDGQVFSYDAMGRVVLNAQTSTLSAGHSTPSGVYEVSYTYDLMGNLVTLTNGAGEGYGQTFTYTNNVIGQPTSIDSSLSDSNHPATIVSSVTYTPFGALSGMTYGNSVQETRSYNNRLQPTEIKEYSALKSNYPMDLTYTWTDTSSHDNGNLTGWNSEDNVVFARTYTYDYLNRLATMSAPSDPSGCTGLSWAYDRYGNRTAQSTTGGSCLSPSTPVNSTTNRLNSTGISYDSAGNMTNDSVHSYTFNALNQVTAVDSGSTSTAAYTVEGWRSNKTMGSNLRDYARARSGQILSEMITSSSGGWDNAYIYLGNQFVAEYTGGSSGTTYFIHQDHLGSTRAVTAMDGSKYDWLDYYPFGEQAGGSTPTTQKFTGYQRDAEDGTASGTDYAMARKYAYSQGRFMSADPLAGDVSNPQSLNRYSYVLNNPLSLNDPTGRVCAWTDENDQITGFDDPPGAGGDTEDQCAAAGGTWYSTTETITVNANGDTYDTGPVGFFNSSGGGSGGFFQQIMGAVCSVLPSGSTVTVSAAGGELIGFTGSAGSLVNYNTGEKSIFLSGGYFAGVNGLVSANVGTGAVYNLGDSNSNYSGPFDTGYGGIEKVGVYSSTSETNNVSEDGATLGPTLIPMPVTGGASYTETGLYPAGNIFDTQSMMNLGPKQLFDMALYVANKLCNSGHH